VVLSSSENIQLTEIVKNEITATLTQNGFETVIFQFPNMADTLTFQDITLPYFKLTFPKSNSWVPAEIEEPAYEKEKDFSPENETHAETNKLAQLVNNPLILWLILSLTINQLFIVYMDYPKKEMIYA
jgi:hypothetical protein